MLSYRIGTHGVYLYVHTVKYATQQWSCNQNLRNICGTIFPPPFCDAYKMSISIYVQSGDANLECNFYLK